MPPEREQSGREPGVAGMWGDILLLLALWLLVAVLLDPRGDFPLNDDWSFGEAVRRLLAGQGFRPTDWTAMPLLPQTLWGALFCLPAGFGYGMLRLAGLSSGAVALAALYVLMRDAGVGRRHALFAGALLGANPIFLALAYTFMTDVPFLALWTLALVFLLRDLRSASRGRLAAGIVLCALATLTRQVGLVLPFAFAVVLALRGHTRSERLRGALPLLTSGLSLLVFRLFMALGPGLPARMELHASRLFTAPAAMSLDILGGLLKALLYLGLFTAPWLLATRAPRGRHARGARIAALILLGAALLYWRRLLPLLPNVIDPAGIGPLTLAASAEISALPAGWWLLVTVLALLAGAALTARLLQGGDHPRPERRFLAGTALCYLVPVAALGLFDRYLLPLLPLVLLLSFRAAGDRSPRPARLALGALILMAAYALAGTHDYLAWNRARWALLGDYEAGGGTPAAMDGGFEYNNLRRVEADRGRLGLAPPPGATSRLAFAKQEGWRLVARRGYSRWLPPGEGEVLLLEREGARER